MAILIVGFSRAVLPDEDLQKAIAFESEVEVFQVLVVADMDGFEPHGKGSQQGESSMNRGFDEAVGEMELGGLGGLEARFEAVAQGH